MQLHTLSFDPPSAPTGPTLLCLPGLGQSAAEFVEISGLREVATELGRRVVFAMPRDRTWNYFLADSPCGVALHALIQSLVTPADYQVDLLGFSAGATEIYTYLCGYGEQGHVRRVVSYAGECRYHGCHPSPGVRVLLISNACDRLVNADSTSTLQWEYREQGGCPARTLTPDPPPPWPDYPGARLGHFWARDLVNPQIVKFLGAP